MKKTLLYFFSLSFFFSFSQVQVGSDIDGENSFDTSGRSISLSSDGSIIAIGATGNSQNGQSSGHVRIFSNTGNEWVQIGQDIDGESADDQLGSSVSLSSDGSVVAIGAAFDIRGIVQIYKNVGGEWTQVGQDIEGGNTVNQFGSSLSLSSDGSIVAVVAVENNSNIIKTKIYKNINDIWTQMGLDINGENKNVNSGAGVSLSSDGNIVAIGDFANNNFTGKVKVYQNINDDWIQIGSDLMGESSFNLFGLSLDISSDGSILGIGAYGNNNNTGKVKIYENISGVWAQIGSDIIGESVGDRSGISLSISSIGTIIAIGAHQNSDNGEKSGHVRIYKNINNVWTQIGSDINGEAEQDLSGIAVSLSSDGTIVGIGAENNDGNGDNSGHVRVFNLSGILSTTNFVFENTNIYPNPVRNQFTIHLKESLILEKTSIYNSLGKLVLRSNKKKTINTENLSSGLYFVEIITNQGIGIKKLIIN